MSDVDGGYELRTERTCRIVEEMRALQLTS